MSVLQAAWAASAVALCGAAWFWMLRRTRPIRSAAAIVAAVAGVAGAAVQLAPSAFAQAPAPDRAPAGAGFTLNSGDMKFILKQIKIAENNATTESGPGAPAVGPGPFQIPGPLSAQGLRTVDGSNNNLFPGQGTFGASDQLEPRLATPFFRPAEGSDVPGVGLVGPPGATTYASKRGNVVDSEPRTISNLIVDQTAANPAAVQAAGKPNRTFLGSPSVPCDASGQPPGCTPKGKTLFIPNVTTDVGLSPPFNAWFTFFGQFFDHGVDFTEKNGDPADGGGLVFVPLKDDDPLVLGPDGAFGTADDLPADKRFMVVTRTKNQPGPDGRLGTDDDVKEASNTDTPWIDQSQTYSSSPSHQVFLREYALNAVGKPVATGELLKGPDGGMGTWRALKDQAATMLGIRLVDKDVFSVPLLAVDEYGRFLRGPNGLPQLVTASGLVEGDRSAPVSVPANAVRARQAFLDDIAHNAAPKPGLAPDADTSITGANGTQPSGTYDDEMLDRHFVAGDGRLNENVGLTAVHQIFHSEHNRLVGYMKDLITTDPALDPAEWQLGPGVWNGERLFQAARFVTEMEYQQLVVDQFARKIAPGIDPFNPGHQGQGDVDPAVKAEFASAVYRFGHSMLTDAIARTNADGTSNDISLLDGFLNPPAYVDGGGAGTLAPDKAAGAIVMGTTDQVGNEIDEFVTDTLRNNLLGLPLDLPSINMTRARDAGLPSLNNLRKQLFGATNTGALRPYSSWVDFGLNLKTQVSVVNFMAAYGLHPSITSQSTIAGRRAAAQRIYTNDPSDSLTPPDAADFTNSTGQWANDPDGSSKTGVDGIDLWVGGLAEKQNTFGGLLGSTFNYVFESQITDLQNADRFYYVRRTAGLNLFSQLEGNTFGELIMRNTNAKALKGDVFGTADCEFELANLVDAGNGAIADDPASGCDESKLLIRMANGTIRYRETNTVDPQGINAQSTFNGTSGTDKVQGGTDNDTFWGNEGNDVIEGNGGDDIALGGVGNDIITDLDGADVFRGGDGNDAVDAGPGLDLIFAGPGSDFTDGGLNGNETFGGDGNDFIIGGNGLDTVFGGSGDDWIEGGNNNDLLQGDSGAPFFDDFDPPGNDVFIGDGGDDDYDAEGGDDIMFVGSGRERNNGLRGYDWASSAREAFGGDIDLSKAIALLPIPPVGVEPDLFMTTEAASGWKFDDVLRGPTAAPAAGNDLDAAGIARIAGLQDVVGAGVTSLAADRTILLGGGGADVMEGRAGDDIIDGDKWLQVRLRAPDPVTGGTRLVENLAPLRGDVFAGKLDPGDISIVRTIETAPAGNDIDTAVFSGPRANYTISPSFNSTEMTVTDTTGTDGSDVVRNVESLQFSDVTLSIAPTAAVAPSSLAFGTQTTGTTSAARTVTLTNNGQNPLAVESIAITGTDATSFARPTGVAGGTCPTGAGSLAGGASCTVRVTFVPASDGAKSATLRFTDNHKNVAGSTQDVALSGTGTPPQPVAGVTPASLTFAARPAGTTSPAQAATLQNTGTAPLAISSIAIAGTNPGDFARSGGSCPAGAGSLAAGASCTVGVTFRPTAGGARTATLVFTDDSNNVPGSTQSVALSGTGQVPVIAVNPASRDFGNNSIGPLGLLGVSRSFTVRNNGNAPLTFGGGAVTIVGPNANNFAVTAENCSNSSRAPGATCSITVRFRALAPTGAKTATLRIVSNAPTSPTNVALTGTATP